MHSNVLGYPKTHKEVEALGLGEVVGKRAADVVGFYPPSQKGELVTRINEVLEGEKQEVSALPNNFANDRVAFWT